MRRAATFLQVIMKPRFQFIFFMAWFSLILILSIIPDNSPDTLKIDLYELSLDYLKHFFVYLPLGFSFMCIKRNATILNILLVLLVVSLPEVLQYFIPYRTYNPFDLLANFIGTITGIVLYARFASKLNNDE